MITKDELYNPIVPNHTLYLKRVDGDYIADVQNKINEQDGMQVIATTILPVIIKGTTQGLFCSWVYYKKRKGIKIQINDVFVKKEKAKSLLK